MTAEIDVYQDCLCGSGKKLKFCCLPIAGDIVRIMRLQDSGQPAAALAALEALDKKPIRAVWSRAWIKSGKASLLGSFGRWSEAKQLIDDVLAELPEHHFSRGLRGFIALQTEGYRAARPILYEALQATAGPLPLLTSELASAVAGQLLQSQHMFAAHQYLSVALAFNPQSERNQETLRKFKETSAISYLFRSEYPLRAIAGPEDANLVVEFLAARRVFNLGCFNLAAQTFRKLARQNPHNAALWYNIGICDASAGEEVLAVRAFREAAAVEPDFETAAEYSALGQTLAWKFEAPQQPFVLHKFRVPSVDKLLAHLDQQPDFVRMADQTVQGRPHIIYRLLDRPWRSLSWETLAIDEVPHEVSFLSIDPAGAEAGDEAGTTGSRAVIMELKNQNRGRPRLDEAVGSDVEFLDTTPLEQEEIEELSPLYVSLYYPDGIARVTLARLTKARWQRFAFEIWPGLKLSALGGKTPREAAGDPELKTKLAGAVLAFHGFAETRNVVFDEDALRGQLGLPPVAPLEIAADANTDELSTLQLRRLRLDTLSDEQFTRVANRTMNLRQWALDRRGYLELVARPNLPMKPAAANLYLKLAALAAVRLNTAEGLDWNAKAKDAARSAKANLTDMLSIEFQELSLRAVDPEDPRLPEIAQRIGQQYLPKLPEYRENVLGLFEKIGLKDLWQSVIGNEERVEAMAGAGTGVWTPEGAAPNPGSKLWLPGQD